jgi:hypothetical protein
MLAAAFDRATYVRLPDAQRPACGLLGPSIAVASTPRGHSAEDADPRWSLIARRPCFNAQNKTNARAKNEGAPLNDQNGLCGPLLSRVASGVLDIRVLDIGPRSR